MNRQISLATLAFLAIPFGAVAQVDVSSCPALAALVERITNALGFIALLAAAVVIIIGAFYLIFGGGSETAAGTGRKYIIFGLVGIAVALAAFTLPDLVVNILGASTPACP